MNALHVAAMGSDWVGVVSLAAIWRLLNPVALASTKRLVLIRSGRIAFTALALLIVNGLLMAGFHLNGLNDLRTTSYGIVVAIKTGLVASIAVGVEVSRRRQSYVSSARWIVETGGIAVVLILAGILISLPPPE